MIEKRYPTYMSRDGRLIEFIEQNEQKITKFIQPLLEEVVKRAVSNAPRTIAGLVSGGLAGALIRGPAGAFWGGLALGAIGLAFDLAERENNTNSF